MKALIYITAAAGIICTAAATTACARDPVAPAGRVAECSDCGTVRGIEAVDQGGKASGAGAVLGAVIGGVVGHQFGSGKGQDAATAAGVVGGAAAGHQIEKNRRTGSVYEVLVRMDTGGTRIVNVADPGSLTVGQRVRIKGRDLEVLS
ncbi:MAG TPA: glycine zipper 2TM domain-containing protein [Verrucomicrobiae bacterium]|nr:glycine zipper 2TM domain-containing protein [Verrucomicrobiae bacterium]